MDLNFSISELSHSDVAIKNNINNMPDINSCDNLLKLIFYILQPCRNKFGEININSGYRCNKVNQLVGGSATSNHKYGYAADITPKKATYRQVYDYIVNNLNYDECFIEKNSKGVIWLHVAYRHNNNRKKHNPLYLV